MTLLTEKAEAEILKTDVLGRVWTPREKREALVAEYERSTMSAVEFAKWSGVKYATFTGWVVKARKARGLKGSGEKAAVVSEPMRWAEAVCEDAVPSGEPAVVIHFGAGVRVEARDGRMAAELLAALGVRAC
jgi:transposase-like protein